MTANIQFFSVDRFGGNRVEHPNAMATEGQALELDIDEGGSISVTIPNNDPNIGMAKEHSREMEIWRNEQFWWIGKIESKPTFDPDKGTWEVTVVDIMTRFKTLTVGRAGRVNRLQNGSFDTGNLDHWTAVGVTAGAVTGWGYRADRSTYQANLYQAGAGQDTFLQQRVDVEGGVNWTLAAWFHIRGDNDWVGPALDGRGLYIERRHPDTNAVEDIQFFAITDDTIRGQYQRATVNMWSPPGRSSVFYVRLYATLCSNAHGSPPGSIIWDEVQLVAPESLSYSHQDVGTVIDGLVSHGQDPDFGKTYLGIDTPGAGTTGVLVDRFYQFADHANIYDELKAFQEAGICDVAVEATWNSGAQKADKHVRAYFPRRGSSTKPFVLELDAAHSIRQLTGIERRGDKTRTTYIVQGEGTGPDREESSYSDTSETDGVVIEEVVQAPQGTHHDLLGGIAQTYVAKNKGVPQVPGFLLAPFMTDHVELGDVFQSIAVIDSIYDVTGNYRIVHISHDLTTDQFTVQVVNE